MKSLSSPNAILPFQNNKPTKNRHRSQKTNHKPAIKNKSMNKT